MRIRGEMKATLLAAVRMELLSRMLDVLPLSMYRLPPPLRSAQLRLASPRHSSPLHASPLLRGLTLGPTRAA
jgi:hypothetical protein